MNTDTNTNSKAALDFFNDAAQTVNYLADRWLDESDYEDINDYKTPLIPIAAKHGVSIEKMTKRPFGCEFVVDGRRFALKASRTQYSYRRIR